MELFFKRIQAQQSALKEFEDKYNSSLALDFNALDFITWNENKVSELLAYFLNPSEGHRHGAVYLKIFVDFLELSFPTQRKEKIKVKVEETTYDNRRVDIVINYDNGKELIGIENKIYTTTTDQENQLKDYYSFLKSISSNDSFTLIYLAPRGKKIPVFSTDEISNNSYEQLIETRKIIAITYEDHIIPVIRQFVQVTDNIRLRSFLQDFERKLSNNYLGKQNLNTNMIKNYITESSDNIRTAFEITNAIEEVKASLVNELTAQMQELASELGGIYSEDHRHFEFNQLVSTYIKYNYEEGGVIYGIVKTPVFYNSNPHKVEFRELKSHLGGKFKTSYWWPLYSLKYERIDVTPDFWLAIVDGSFKEFMKAFILTVLNAPKEILDQL